jgi:hypothetical protein
MANTKTARNVSPNISSSLQEVIPTAAALYYLPTIVSFVLGDY